MRKTAIRAAKALPIAALLGIGLALPLQTSAADGASDDKLAMGKDVAFDRKKGNCLACHMIGDEPSPGDIGPPLVAMQARFADKQKLRDQIWDPMKANPNTRMPPFGKHKILSDEEIDAIVEYLYTL